MLKSKPSQAKSGLTKSLSQNIHQLTGIFDGDETLIIRRFQNKYLAAAKCGVLYFEGMVNADLVNQFIIKPILENNLLHEINSHDLLDELLYKVIASNSVIKADSLDEITGAIASGDTIFLLDGFADVLIFNSKGWSTRAITEPESQRVLRGPREGFTESIVMNISLLRRKLKSPDLKLKFQEIGVRSRTRTCICYLDGIALESVLRELEQRLARIDLDAILDSGYIQELIKDAPFSPFETVGYTERPDVVASKLLEGRVALFVDGSPFVLTVPYIMAEGTQASEDYYNNYIFASINRFLRLAATLVTISTPALYLALTTYHQEFLPTPLLLSISASRQGVPFPTGLSLFIMLMIFDLLREAGTRMPANVGQAVNIVGTLVLGQAAVEAKLVSAPVVIVTAFTGITTLLNTTMIGSVIVIRFFLLFTTAALGIYGFLFGLLFVLIHLMNIRSFGVPYMLTLSSALNHNGQDTWIRAPWWMMTLRPKIMAVRNLVRQTPRRSGGSGNEAH